jgi:hypothetical protein
MLPRIRLSIYNGTAPVVSRVRESDVGQPINNFKDEHHMSQNHYVTKPKRRQKSKKRKDVSAGTMAKVRQLEAADKKK